MDEIIIDIVSQHAEEAAFLWLLRDRAVYAPHYSLADLSELDDRVEAHLDGLRIAGDAGALSILKSFIRPDVPYQEEAAKMALR